MEEDAEPDGGANMAKKAGITAKVDADGRLILPAPVRKKLGLKKGDIVHFDGLEVEKKINPFDGLAMLAIEELEKGETIPLEKLKEKYGLVEK